MEKRFRRNNIKVLIAPTVMMEDGEVQSEFKRTVLLIMKLVKANDEVALCISKNSGYKIIEETEIYPAPTPSPFGISHFLGGMLMDFLSNRYIEEKKNVDSYEECLYIHGILEREYFKEDIEAMREAIRKFKPDVVYTETRLSAIVAAVLEDVKVVTAYSAIKNDSNSGTQYIQEVMEIIKELHINNIHSIQDIFNLADLKVVQGCYEFEPVDSENTLFIEPIIQTRRNIGSFYKPQVKKFEKPSNKILVNMDNSSVQCRKLLKEMRLAIENSNYEVYVKTNQVSAITENRIYVDKNINLDALLRDSLLFINNGEFDSVMMGINFGIPQIIYPGNILDRRHNAAVINNLKCGIYLKNNQFTAKDLRENMDLIKDSVFYRYNSNRIARSVFNDGYGGASMLVDILEDIARKDKKSIW